MDDTKPATTLPHTRSYLTLNRRVYSASRLRIHSSSTLIKVHPPRPTTKLRRIPIARHSTIIRTTRMNSRRLDTFAIAIATAVTSTQKGAVSIIVHIRIFDWSFI